MAIVCLRTTQGAVPAEGRARLTVEVDFAGGLQALIAQAR